MLTTNKDTIGWVDKNLGAIHKRVANEIYPDFWVTKHTLNGIVNREVGFLIRKYVNKGYSFEKITLKMIGDGGHGISYYQIDDRSYLNFIQTHRLENVIDWTIQAVKCLIEKATSLINAGFNGESLEGLAAKLGYDSGEDLFQMANVCAYNCGQGNVIKSLRNGKDPNQYTFPRGAGDYGFAVMNYRYISFNNFNEDDNDTISAAIDNSEQYASTEPIENAKAIDGHDEINPGAFPGERSSNENLA